MQFKQKEETVNHSLFTIGIFLQPFYMCVCIYIHIFVLTLENGTLSFVLLFFT